MKKVINTTAHLWENYRTWLIALAVILTVFFISGSLGNWINLTKLN